MNVSWRYALGLLAALWAVAAFAQQPDPLTDFEITGHVYEPQPIAPTDERLQQVGLPSGFHVHRYAEGLYNPRILATADDGTVYATQRTPGNLVMLRDVDNDGVVDAQKVVLRLKDLHGIAIHANRIWLVTIHTVYAADLNRDGTPGELEVVTSGLPDAGQHPNRTLGLGSDGKLYLSVGSTCNACDETSFESATLLQIDPANGDRRVFASGLRNTIGFDWHPVSGRLYGMDQGIDWLGDDEQSEELNELVGATRYGWPYVYDDDQLNPQDEPARFFQPNWAEASVAPVAGHAAHAAAMQMLFYEASLFPAAYRSQAFVSFHGSWNRKPPSGYEVALARFSSAGDFEGFEPFLTGFLQPQPDTAPPFPGAQPSPPDGFIARPVGLTVARDGALLIADDSNNAIYRVTYGDDVGQPSPQALAIDIVQPSMPEPIVVGSPAFGPGEPIPLRYSDYGEGISPPLSFSSVPDETRQLVVMVEDPDATSPLPFVHWLALFPGGTRQLPPDIPKMETWPRIPDARQGSNSRTETGWLGPRPPAGDDPHAYHFHVFALNSTLDLPSGFNRHALLEAMEGHVLAEGELVGTFAKEP